MAVRKKKLGFAEIARTFEFAERKKLIIQNKNVYKRIKNHS